MRWFRSRPRGSCGLRGRPNGASPVGGAWLLDGLWHQLGIDALLPGMKFATVASSPVLGGKVRRVDDTAVKSVPGVQKVVVLDDMVAVVGDHMWAAKKGLESQVLAATTEQAHALISLPASAKRLTAMWCSNVYNTWLQRKAPALKDNSHGTPASRMVVSICRTGSVTK